MVIKSILVCVLGYLLGAVPTGVIITKLLKGINLTTFGSGHTGATNVKRAVGMKAAIFAAILDILWGTLSVWVAWLITHNYLMAAAAGSAAIIGHNWSLYIRMQGGIGLSTLYGSLLFFQPLIVTGAVLIIVAIRMFLVKILHFHRNRVTIFCMLLFPLILKCLTIRLEGILLCAIGGLVVIIKTIPDWNRVYDKKIT
ncbi:glycerol-3-phosphate acyltransferase [bacterium]|nr:glycerol-3-phosphate acyltransferase [bacterium]MBU1064583.1 glycerol-3-phosphate acyltransferase [bacterium]MBU1635241.1 glycerol-3-phosphate acyltransferase [bacterium]MBU1873439.1 glycerol-3-phosphate acyltransferase [bacterium]